MADELRLPYQGAATLYAVIRRIADGYVWNGTAFEAFSAGSIANYDIALTDQGGDYYTADWPTAMAAGTACTVLYYYQAGGSPATTDDLLHAEDVTWTGTTTASVSSITLSVYALTSLDDLKTYMGITASTYDTVLTLLINGMSAAIEKVVSRQFKARDRRGWFALTQQRRVQLPHAPAQHVTRVAYGTANGLTVAYSGAAIGAQAAVYRDPESPDGGGVRLVSWSTAGTQTSNNLTFALYPSLTAMETAIELISGWTATVHVNRPSYELRVTGGQNAKAGSVTFPYADQDYADAYRLDHDRALLEFDVGMGGPYGWWPQDPAYGRRRFPTGHQELYVQWRSGFETVPEDVADLCREMVKEKYYTRLQNTALAGYSLGPYSVQFGQQDEERVRARLARHIGGRGWVGALV